MGGQWELGGVHQGVQPYSILFLKLSGGYMMSLVFYCIIFY